MAEPDAHADLIHATRNCTQVLQALHRRVERAFEALDAGDVKKGMELLEPVREGIPQAMRIIAVERCDDADAGPDA